MKITLSSIILFGVLALVNSDGLDESYHSDQSLDEVPPQLSNEAEPKTNPKTAEISGGSQPTHFVAENQQRDVQQPPSKVASNMKESVGQSSNQKTGENQLKPEQSVPSIQSKMVNNDPQPKLQPSETADDAKISHIPAPAVPQQANPEKQRIAQQPTNVDSLNGKTVISTQNAPAVQPPSTKINAADVKGPSKKQRTTTTTRKPMHFNNEIDNVFHQIFELIAWEKYDNAENQVDAMYSVKNKMKCVAPNQFSKIESTYRECKQAVPNLIGMAQMTGKSSLKKEHTPMMIKTCLFGQLLSGREAHGFGLISLLKDLSDRPLNSNTMLSNIRSLISASSLPSDQKIKAMDDAKKCINEVMPISNLVLQIFTDNKGVILDKFVVKWMTMLFNNKWESHPASDISELKPLFVILKGSMCLVKSLTTNGCYLKNSIASNKESRL